jgi:oligopeptide/dipeptide ABC transporter ATP-binding protein
MTTALLKIAGLRVEYPLDGGTVTAIDDVDLEVGEGGRVGLVGESGSGKSTLAFAATRLLRPPGRTTAGRVDFEGRDLLGLDEAACDEIRGAQIAMVYQDPFSFLNPVIRVGDQIGEALRVHGSVSRRSAYARAVTLLERLALRPGGVLARKYPHQLSGGQRQRAVIAMALINRPKLLVADEPTTALDVTVQAQILRVLSSIIGELGTSLLLISHDLAVIKLMCERIYVMYAGKIVESGPADELFATPRHPYTQALLRASGHAVDSARRFFTIPGAPPDMRRPPQGCRFANRCPHRMEICATPPALTRVNSSGAAVACWLSVPR